MTIVEREHAAKEGIMGPARVLPAAHIRVDAFFAQYGSLVGWAIVGLGVFYAFYGVRQYPYLRSVSRSLLHVALNVLVCGLVLYLLFGFVQSTTSSAADLGFLAAHIIVVGMLTALVSGALVAFARQSPEPQESGPAQWHYWAQRFLWGLLAGLIAGPVVGTLAELMLAGTPSLGFPAPGRGVLILGDIFGIVAGWFVVAPLTGLLNVLRVRLDEQVARLPANSIASAGTLLALCGLILTGFAPFSPETAHAVAHSIVLPLAGR